MFSRPPKKVNPNRQVGEWGEEKACEYLLSHGFKIVERNFRTRWGEIDIIASKAGEIYFIEVKTRQNGSKGAPLDSLPPYRLMRFRRIAEACALQRRWQNNFLHLSLLGVKRGFPGESVEFIKDIA